MQFNVFIELGEDGFWLAHVPSLRGCHSQGKTRNEAIANIKEAIRLFLETDIGSSDTGIDIDIHAVTIHNSSCSDLQDALSPEEIDEILDSATDWGEGTEKLSTQVDEILYGRDKSYN